MKQLNFFTENSPYLQHPLLTPERTAREIDFLLTQLHLPPKARILDVGCGFGRHSLELSLRGYQVVGIDPSAAMIAAAQTRAADLGAAVEFQTMAGEYFQSDIAFDGVICLFTTLGQVSISDGNNSNEGLIEAVYRILKLGGRFVVEVPQRSPAVRALKETDQFGQGENYTAVTRRFDEITNQVTESFRVVSPEVTRHFLLQYRLYTQTELTQLLEQAGFTVETIYGGYEEKTLQPDSLTMLSVSRK